MIQVEKKGKYLNLNTMALADGDTLIFTKNYASCRELAKQSSYDENKTYTLYSCQVTYNGEVVSFLLKRKEDAQAFNETGGIGDKVKMTCKYVIVEKTVRGVVKKVVEQRFNFEKV